MDTGDMVGRMVEYRFHDDLRISFCFVFLAIILISRAPTE